MGAHGGRRVLLRRGGRNRVREGRSAHRRFGRQADRPDPKRRRLGDGKRRSGTGGLMDDEDVEILGRNQRLRVLAAAAVGAAIALIWVAALEQLAQLTRESEFVARTLAAAVDDDADFQRRATR